MTAISKLRNMPNPLALRGRNDPINQWWVAATSAELGSKQIQRWLLELPIVAYRGENGEAVALDDRCRHPPEARRQFELRICPRGANYLEVAVCCDRPGVEARRLLQKSLEDQEASIERR